MRASEIVQALKDKKGQHVQVVWARSAKTVADCPLHVVKRTAAYVRTGISYANLSSVKDGISTGTRGEVGKLPFGHWRHGFENYIIDHTPKGDSIPVEYVRLYPASFPNLQKPRVEWLADGVVTTFKDIKQHLDKSELRKEKEQPLCFTVKAANIIEIAGE